MIGDSSADGRSLLGRVRDRLEGPNTIGDSTTFWGAFAVVVAALAVYPQVVGPYTVIQTSRYFALAFLALSLCFIWGYAGVLSFGQVAFFGVAAYVFGIVGINLGSVTGAMVALVAAVVGGTLAAALLGYFMFYGGVRDTYVTIMTLVVALVLNTFMAQTAGSEWAVGEAQLGGFNGMNVPSLAFGIGQSGLVLERAALYYALLVTLVATYLGLRVLVNGSFGMTMVAVREDEARTATFGYDVPFVKLVVFTIGGALAAVGGVFYASWGNYVDPTVFGIGFAALPVVWVSIGGRESLLGAIGATLVIERMRTELSSGIGPVGSEWALVIVGGLLLTVILFMPAGVVPTLDDLADRARSRRTEQSQSTTATEEPVE
ncbi:urea ABC transporter permease [Halorubrum sp. CBA1125]|uniref:ABC transporter permease subunit n=1 Tax=Halorubrum sp. CBA1125 TaxID=2668072 RepID=UPI0012E916E4|nr:urea ABC transporter permease [Halorubrum sp. CBA1125]MUW14986.1 urea ABC transporter permease [Halorubrum sp. CBA1125]